MPRGSLMSEEDFLQAYDDHADHLFRHCHVRVKDRELSKELMKEAFQQLWLFIARGNYVDSLRIFLYRELNLLIEERQKRGTINPQIEVELLGPRWSFLPALEPEPRLVCILHYMDGFSSEEIGEIIGGSALTHGETLQRLQADHALPLHV